jgi:hypothetical protein
LKIDSILIEVSSTYPTHSLTKRFTSMSDFTNVRLIQYLFEDVERAWDPDLLPSGRSLNPAPACYFAWSMSTGLLSLFPGPAHSPAATTPALPLQSARISSSTGGVCPRPDL